MDVNMVNVEELKIATNVDDAGNHIVRTAVDLDLCTLTRKLAIQYTMADKMFEARHIRTADMIEKIADDAAAKIHDAVRRQLYGLNERNISYL